MLLESLLLAGYSQAALSLTVTEKQKNASKKSITKAATIPCVNKWNSKDC